MFVVLIRGSDFFPHKWGEVNKSPAGCSQEEQSSPRHIAAFRETDEALRETRGSPLVNKNKILDRNFIVCVVTFPWTPGDLNLTSKTAAKWKPGWHNIIYFPHRRLFFFVSSLKPQKPHCEFFLIHVGTEKIWMKREKSCFGVKTLF